MASRPVGTPPEAVRFRVQSLQEERGLRLPERHLDAAIWGAELAGGEGPGRVYVVEPTGPIEDDPNLTDKKYPGNPTRSYRSRDPLRVTGEIHGWKGHSAEQLQAMRDSLERLRRLGIEAIED